MTELLNVGKDALLNSLKKLAYQAHSGQPELVGTADIAEDALSRELLHISQNPHLRVNLLKTHLSDRAGLLVPRGVNVYSFPHRSFQEYLAAAYLYDHPDHTDFPNNVAQLTRSEPERWREVVLLAAQLSNATALWRLVEELCQADPETTTQPSADAYGALLAAQALDETKTPANTPPLQEKKERLRRWLKAILTEGTPFDSAQGTIIPLAAIDRAMAGDLLAAFGDDRKGVGVIAMTHPLPLPGGETSDNSPPGRGKGWVLPDIDWITIPAGEFWMGSDENDREKPRHLVTFREPFWMSRYPVTNAQYQAFVTAGGYENKAYWEAGGGWDYKEKYEWNGLLQFSDARYGLPNHPVVSVSWYEAMAFCAWLTGKTTPPGAT